LLYSSHKGGRPGPKGPSKELVDIVVEMKRRNPRLGCRFHPRRIIGFGVAPAELDGPSVCQMFNCAIANQRPPKYISSDNDPLFRFHRCLANLRVLEVEEIKAVPCAARSQAFVERLIGTLQARVS